MKCTNCGNEITEGTRYCKYCGAQVILPKYSEKPRVKKCRKCGAPIKEGFVFCDQCGTPLDESETVIEAKIETGKKGNGIRKFIVALVSIAIIAGAGLFAYKTIGNRNQSGGGDSIETAAGATLGMTGQESLTDDTTKSTDQHIESDASAGSTNQQDVAEADTGFTSQIDTTGTGTVDEEVTDDVPTENHIIPDSVPDKYYTYNGHTYAFYDASRYGFDSYREILDFCEKQGGHLAVINDSAENTFLFGTVRDNYVKTAFFGYSDEEEEGVWEWADGSDNDYENWTTYGDWDLPDNGIHYGGDEDYAEFNYERDKPGIPSDGTWNDAPFMDNTTVFICEWEYVIENK